MTKTPVLLPCPFCGGKSVLVKSNEYRDDGVIEYPKCTSCGAHSTNVKDDSIKEWNTRVYSEEVQEALEKQMPKEPTDVIYINERLIGVCSACGATINTGNRFCRICGQKQDWSTWF